MAQEKKNYSSRENIIYENLKSMFKKPQYESCIQEYSSKDIFPEIHFTEREKSAVIDSLQKNGTLKIENDTKGFKLNMELKFSGLFNSLTNTQSISILNENIQFWMMQLSLIESQLYNSASQKLKVNKAYTSIDHRSKISTVLNEKHGKDNVYFNYISVRNPINDSINPDSLYTGSATYQIKIITSYDSIRCNKKDISKIIKLNGATYQIVTIEDNKVVLAILENKRVFNELGVLSFDSIGKSLIHHVKNKDNLSTHLYSFPLTQIQKRYFTALKKSYDIIKKNPQLTIDEYNKAMSDCSKDELQQKYIFLECDSPLINDFLIYTPIYGFEKLLELKLKN